MNNINALVDVLKQRCSEIAGADLPEKERAVAVDLATVGIELLRQLLLDIHRCADALEWLARIEKREAAMIDRQSGNIVFECDSCDEVLDAETGDFDEAWSRAKREGWRARKIGDQWVHACPECEE